MLKTKKILNVFLINSFFVKTIFNIVILFFQLNTFFFLCFVLIFFIPETNHCTNAILKHRIVEAQVCISIKEVLKYILQ